MKYAGQSYFESLLITILIQELFYLFPLNISPTLRAFSIISRIIQYLLIILMLLTMRPALVITNEAVLLQGKQVFICPKEF